jgi:hypothetical protein
MQNANGSTTIWLGPKGSIGKRANWIATIRGKGWFAVIRLYGSKEAALNRS